MIMTEFKNRVFGCVAVKAINSNYNADFSGQPRTLPNGKVYATDKALKYPIKNYLKEIYGENVTYGKEIIIEDADFKYLDSYFSVTDQNNQIGTVFITSGSNAYGNINMAIGINYDESGTLGVMKLIENGQSFASILQSNYVDKYNNGEIGIYDTSCGATYGAILIKDMALQAQEYFVEKIGFMPVDLNEQEVR